MNNELERMFYRIRKDENVKKMFIVDKKTKTFSETNKLIIDITDVVRTPLVININNTEWSLTINETFGIYFGTEQRTKGFIDEMFFAMEEYHNLPHSDRSVPPNKH